MRRQLPTLDRKLTADFLPKVGESSYWDLSNVSLKKEDLINFYMILNRNFIFLKM